LQSFEPRQALPTKRVVASRSASPRLSTSASFPAA
jgi:hypothetical protein